MDESFENLAYSWEMFLIEHFQKIKNLHYNDYDCYIIMQVVNSHFIYNKKKDKAKEDKTSWNDLFQLANSDYRKIVIAEKNKLSISSISRVTTIPIETTRRKLQKLSNEGVIEINNNSITIGPKHNEVWKKIGSEEVKLVRNFIENIKNNGALRWLESKEAIEIVKTAK